MLSVYRVTIKTTRGEQRGKYKVILTAKEGMYSFTVPQTVFGKLLYRVVKQKPLTIDFGRKNALQLKTGDLNLKGIKPVGKTSSKLVTYTPIRRRPKKETAATASPVPTIGDVPASLSTATTKKDKDKKKDKEIAKREDKGKKNREKNRGKQAVATAA